MYDNYTTAQKATIQQLKTHLAQGKGQMTVVAMRSELRTRSRTLSNVCGICSLTPYPVYQPTYYSTLKTDNKTYFSDTISLTNEFPDE